MEPLLGGKLANPPQPVQALWESAVQKRTPAAWALQWLWNRPGVSVVLSGMSTLDQVEQNIASAGLSGVDTLAAEELALVERVRARYREYRVIPY
jgi:predicted aldo/keto reductase-like oxidoreductase